MEKRHKQFEYARMVMEKNRMELSHKKPPKFPRHPDKQGEEGAKRKTVRISVPSLSYIHIKNSLNKLFVQNRFNHLEMI